MNSTNEATIAQIDRHGQSGDSPQHHYGFFPRILILEDGTLRTSFDQYITTNFELHTADI